VRPTAARQLPPTRLHPRCLVRRLRRRRVRCGAPKRFNDRRRRTPRVPTCARRNIVGYVALAKIDSTSHKIVAKDVASLRSGPAWALVLELMKARARGWWPRPLAAAAAAAGRAGCGGRSGMRQRRRGPSPLALGTMP
jgi:hypothetical protein